ncbi:MAG: hypothetical protein V7K55_03365 [Nostoc sp.]
MIEADKISVVIDCTYPLVELAAAHGYSGSEWGEVRSRNIFVQ